MMLPGGLDGSMHASSRATALLALFLLSLTLAPAADAQTSTQPPRESVWTVFTTVEAVVEGNYATVKVIADIGNRGPDPEFPFAVRVPDDAFVTGLTIERDGEVHVARIAPREEARREYDAWKAQEQTGGLVEKQRRSDVYAYLVNVAEFTSVRATLTYERYLVAENGVYNLSLEVPVSGFGEDLGAAFQVRVLDAASAWGSAGDARRRDDGAWSLSHVVGPRSTDAPTPWQAAYTMPSTPDAGEIITTVHNGTGYFAHRFRAEPDARQAPMDLVLVLDVSGSMTGEKIAQLQDAAKQVARTLTSEDRLHLALFSSGVVSPWDGLRDMTPDARHRAAQEISAIFAGGATNIEGGLRRAIDAIGAATPAEREARLQVVALLTDGQPTEGVVDRAALRDIAADARSAGARVYSIAFGHDADWALVHELAEAGGGVALRVPEGTGAEVDIQRFIGALTTPVLHDVQVTYSDGVVARNAHADILPAGSELLVVGTFDPDLGVHATVRAISANGVVERAIDAQPPRDLAFLPRLAAYHEIQQLQDALDAGEGGATRDRLVELALAHGFVTDETSLVLTLPARTFDPRAASGSQWSGEAVPSSMSDTTRAPMSHLWTATPVPTAPAGRATGAAGAGGPGVATPAAEVPSAGIAGLLALVVVAALAARRRP